jgi:hypothetical protein
MTNLKKLLLLTLVTSNCLLADVSVMPFIGAIKYDNSLIKSLKDNSVFLGLEADISKHNYLLEANYKYSNIKYKDTLNLQSLIQHDLSMIYTSIHPSYALKIGGHYINNNESTNFRDLGTGYIGIAGLEGYNSFNQMKLSYGLEAFYSVYPTAHSDTSTAYTLLIDVVQFTPYLKYSLVLNQSLRNDISFKVNAIASTQYKDPGYLSYEFTDTVVYDKFYAILKVFTGEMKSGVKDGGVTVMNTKDLYTSAYDFKAGYYLSPTLALDFSYGVNYYQEYNAATLTLSPEGQNSVGMISLSYDY